MLCRLCSLVRMVTVVRGAWCVVRGVRRARSMAAAPAAALRHGGTPTLKTLQRFLAPSLNSVYFYLAHGGQYSVPELPSASRGAAHCALSRRLLAPRQP